MKTLIFLFLLSMPSLVLAKKPAPKAQLQKALSTIERGDYVRGSMQLYWLSRSLAYKNKRIQIKYTLGIAFMEMKLYHMASLQFLYVIKKDRWRYKGKALDKLSALMEYLEDDNIFLLHTRSS